MELDMSTEDAAKLLISGGLVSPDWTPKKIPAPPSISAA
jgi:uncharacterized membrane protein